MIKLIAIDIDGTLINSKHEITPRVHAALTKAKEQGVYVVLCTGRPLPGVQGYLKELNLINDRDFVVTYNGSLVQKTGTGESLVRFGMTMDDLKLMDDYHQQYGVHYHAIDEKNIYVTTPDIGKYSYMERDLVGMPIVQQPLDQFDPNATFSKMMFVDEPEILENLIPNLSDSFKENHNIVRSMPVYLEVLHPQASKGHAVAKLAELLGLDASEVMCIGDQGNDKDMIEYAGMGVAMGNAIDEIKALANFITTTCDEDGVAVAVETHVLNTEN